MRIRTVDAFTDQPFSGNPAAVCLLDAGDWPAESWLRQVAAELNLSETAFARPLGTGSWALRWFTPAAEVKLCGHATLATSHLLGPGTHRFETLSGLLTARVAADGLITLDFPAAPPVEVPAPPDFPEAFGATPVSTHRADQLGDLLALLPDEDAVRSLRPDFKALAGLRASTGGLRGFIATAPAAAGAGHDFVSRFFAPADGIDEDPVTGGAHTVLAPFWSERLGRLDLTGRQLSARTGVVRTRMRGDRVDLIGRAVTVLDAMLLHPPVAAMR
ncbi:PhzF family phenazine biosynthesis protein [Actinoplanes sp. N902-109]|uniref:PhzF family phenazine biosynthesis protein n=1 Tax=Actinoplanes sp. (strain N902-109) TaxID=649831 RepID=UPI0003295328|nr:PhzF family phenazine biosynthesis protein [Actinoplanes sp. N902-109]AGL14756.1 phenazine biosynthesis protein PhzF family protein [Actinoplanes sp. N902-109]